MTSGPDSRHGATDVMNFSSPSVFYGPLQLLFRELYLMAEGAAMNTSLYILLRRGYYRPRRYCWHCFQNRHESSEVVGAHSLFPERFGVGPDFY